MTLTLAEVRGSLVPDEPRYLEIARELGAEALPHLKELIERRDPIAPKAAYLAGFIEDEAAGEVLIAASQSDRADVRVAAAFAARHSKSRSIPTLLETLQKDTDAGVRLRASRARARRSRPA